MDLWDCIFLVFGDVWICLITTHLPIPKNPKIQRLREPQKVQKPKIQRSKNPKVWNLFFELMVQPKDIFQRFGFLGFLYIWIFVFFCFGDLSLFGFLDFWTFGLLGFWTFGTNSGPGRNRDQDWVCNHDPAGTVDLLTTVATP